MRLASAALLGALLAAAAVMDVEPPAPTMGATMRVTASSLNLRSCVGTSHAILRTIGSNHVAIRREGL